jgi:hypothetical protein
MRTAAITASQKECASVHEFFIVCSLEQTRDRVTGEHDSHQYKVGEFGKRKASVKYIHSLHRASLALIKAAASRRTPKICRETARSGSFFSATDFVGAG